MVETDLEKFVIRVTLLVPYPFSKIIKRELGPKVFPIQ